MAGNIFTAIVFIAIAVFFYCLLRSIRNTRLQAFTSAIEKGLFHQATESQVRGLQSVFRRNCFARKFAVDRIRSVGVTDDGIHVFDSDLGGFKAFIHAKSNQLLDLVYACKPEPNVPGTSVVSMSTKPYFRGTPASWPDHFNMGYDDLNLGILRGEMTDELTELTQTFAGFMRTNQEIKHVMWGDGWLIVGIHPPRADKSVDGTVAYEQLIQLARDITIAKSHY